MIDDRFARRLPDLMHDLVGNDERYIDDILARTGKTRQRAAWTFPARWLPAPTLLERLPADQNRLVIVLLLVAMLALLVGTAAFVGSQRGPGLPSSYEAVFLRRDNPSDVLVIGVDSQGRERVITRLTNAWSHELPSSHPEPAGAISPTGLLAIPVGTNPFDVRWTIFDVLRPDATPIVIDGIARQDVDQLSYSYFVANAFRDARPSWGPGERLAIYWYERIPQGDGAYGQNYFVTYADGRTGEATSIDIPDAYRLLPQWTADGSGILVDTRSASYLRADGTLAPASGAVPEAGCGRPPSGNHLKSEADVTAVCFSPDESLIAQSIGFVDPSGSLSVQATGESFEIVGRFAGWLRVHP